MATRTATAHKNFVGGEWVDAVEGATMDVINPATGDKIAEVPRGTQADVDRVVEAAGKALPEGLASPPGERRTMLRKMADIMDEHAEELARLESLNTGKPWAVAVDEPGLSADCVGLIAGATRVLGGK